MPYHVCCSINAGQFIYSPFFAWGPLKPSGAGFDRNGMGAAEARNLGRIKGNISPVTCHSWDPSEACVPECLSVCVCLCVCVHSGGKASRIRTETPPGSLQTEPSLRADLNHRQREDEGQVQLHTEVPHQPAPWPITTPHLTAQHNTTRHSGKLVQTV